MVSLPVSRQGCAAGTRAVFSSLMKLLPVRLVVLNRSGNKRDNNAVMVKSNGRGGLVNCRWIAPALALLSSRSSGLRLVKLFASRLCDSIIDALSMPATLKPINGFATNINAAKQKKEYSFFAFTALLSLNGISSLQMSQQFVHY